MKIILGVIAYICISIASGAALNANWRAEITCRYPSYEVGRKVDRAFRTQMLIAFIPVFWVVAPIVTGLYTDGFTLEHGNCSPAEAAARETT